MDLERLSIFETNQGRFWQLTSGEIIEYELHVVAELSIDRRSLKSATVQVWLWLFKLKWFTNGFDHNSSKNRIGRPMTQSSLAKFYEISSRCVYHFNSVIEALPLAGKNCDSPSKGHWDTRSECAMVKQGILIEEHTLVAHCCVHWYQRFSEDAHTGRLHCVPPTIVFTIITVFFCCFNKIYTAEQEEIIRHATKEEMKLLCAHKLLSLWVNAV